MRPPRAPGPARPALRPIADVARQAGLTAAELIPYGRWMAKVSLHALRRLEERAEGRVILVTSINPTPAGEGKTTTAIGLAQALCRLGERAVVCLREPSMGPIFGQKGGATGGGRATVEPAEAINLHFTGDLHAVTAAHNLLAAALDDHLYRGRAPRLDPGRVFLPRVLDVNDRALRRVLVALDQTPREDRFDITAASEVMAVLALATSYRDLRQRLARIVVGATPEGTPVTADDLGVAGAMAALLRDALLPNLVQTQEGGPALVHAGPFANIAHGTSSLVALRLACRLAAYVVVEAGFGADLGAEKFIHIVGAHGGPRPAVAVVVVTTRALKYHGGVPVERLAAPDEQALRAGLPLLGHHLGIVRRLGMRPVVCLNAFATDAPDEQAAVLDAARAWLVPAAVSRAYEAGGEGALEVADLVRRVAQAAPGPGADGPAGGGGLYPAGAPLADKIRTVAQVVYNAAGVEFADAARARLTEAEAWGCSRLPVCIAKTQYSLSDRPQLRGVPTGVVLRIRDAAVRAGAGFVLAVAGEMLTMPALGARPRAREIDIDDDGTILGLQV
jgi:formate--tetrahydrofolate ligase